MEKEFVPYELAVKLKVLGFDKPCLFAFDNCSTPMRCSNLRTNDQKFNGVNYNSSTYTSQPTFSQAFRWFREKYGMIFTLIASTYYYPSVSFINTDGNSEIELGEFETYEKAEIACLDKLIELTFKSE